PTPPFPVKSLLRCPLLGLFALGLVHAAPVERELGQGLVYYRVHALPADLPTNEGARKQPCVLDLRYVRADAATATVLQAWLRFRAGPHTPIFVLANSDTDPLLRAVCDEREVEQSVIVIGIAAKDFRPEVAVPGNAENERRAYNAFEQGAALPALLTDNPGKVRNDEASLSKDRLAE